VKSPDYDALAREAILTDDDELPSERRKREQAGKRKPRAERLPRVHVPFAVVPISWLKDRRHWADFPPRCRLLLYLIYRTHRGQKPYALTNVEAEDFGLSRFQKSRLLTELERAGRVRVEREGKKTRLVHLIWLVG
jgi:hypothetical protein